MATAVTVPSILDSSPEKNNGFKLRRLIVDGGTQALRDVFQTRHAGTSVQTVLSANHHILRPLKGKVIKQTQWDKLYPTPPNIPDINTFDITLLSILLRNICGLTPPATGWSTMPSASDTSDEANIVRIKFFRNELYAHISETSISTKDFKSYWNKIGPVLVSLGIDQKEIDRLKAEECGKEVEERVMKEWNAMEDELRSELKIIEGTQQKTLRIGSRTQQIVKEMQEEQKIKEKHLIENQVMLREELAKLQKELSDAKSSRSDEVLTKLAGCNFTSEREGLCNKFVEGTRAWVFDQVDAWFKDDLSENRAFIISGNAGMGKSVIAAVICEKMNQQLAGCHFCRHNDIRYSDPKIVLQSLARQICNVLPQFKQALINQLSRNLGSHSLNEMNIESLFTILLKEPFSHVDHPGKKFVIVIDGVDESDDSKARHEFVDLIAMHLPKLPNFVQFLITTRPEKNIVDKFEPLNPLYLQKDEVNNKNDLRVFFENKLSYYGSRALTQELVEKFASMSDGLMLYAFFLFEIFKEKQVFESLPTGLNHVFEMYFERLESEAKKVLKINEETFLLLLSGMVVAFEPLPLDFVVSILGVKRGTPTEKRNVVKAMNCISSLFVINDDHVSFFHKSVKDWLVGESDHLYKIDEKYGHEVLAKQCAECFDKIKAIGIESSVVTTAANSYALQYGFEHMIKDDDQFVSYVNSYLVDAEIVYGRYICNSKSIGRYIEMMKLNKAYSQVADNTKVKLDQWNKIFVTLQYLAGLISAELFRLEINDLTDMSSEALSIFTRTYNETYYKKVDKPNLLDVCSMNSNCVVLCFEPGYVTRLISKNTFTGIRTKTFSVSQFFCRWQTFHPRRDVILPGNLDHNRFTICCFSLDQTIKIKGYGGESYLVLWNLVNGEEVRRIQCFGLPTSVRFRWDGNYRAVVVDY